MYTLSLALVQKVGPVIVNQESSEEVDCETGGRTKIYITLTGGDLYNGRAQITRVLAEPLNGEPTLHVINTPYPDPIVPGRYDADIEVAKGSKGGVITWTIKYTCEGENQTYPDPDNPKDEPPDTTIACN